MASKKKQSKTAGDPASEAYEAALTAFADAVEKFGKGDYALATEAFRRLVADNPDEIELCARARTYLTAAARRTAPDPDRPETSDDHYYRGLLDLNARRLEAAVESFDAAIAADPDSAKAWYARAAARALAGDAARVASDLRRAVEIDPTVRFQAVNDPDFDTVRDDAAFIDIVEPTPSEA